MIPGAVLYAQWRKARHFTEAMLAGFPAREAASESAHLDAEARLHILGGLQFGCLGLMQQILEARARYVFWDRAYLGGGSQSDRLRITLDAYQKVRVDAGRGLERFERFGGRLQPWHTGGGHVLLVPPGEAIQTLFCGRDWLERTLADLQACTDRPVRVSHKGDPVPLEERLRDCWCVVTYSSNVAVEAILAGVPAYASHLSAATPVAGCLAEIHNHRGVEQPPRPEREAWAASLAWGQFTVDEIRGGLARAVVLEGWA